MICHLMRACMHGGIHLASQHVPERMSPSAVFALALS